MVKKLSSSSTADLSVEVPLVEFHRRIPSKGIKTNEINFVPENENIATSDDQNNEINEIGECQEEVDERDVHDTSDVSDDEIPNEDVGLSHQLNGTTSGRELMKNHKLTTLDGSSNRQQLEFNGAEELLRCISLIGGLSYAELFLPPDSPILRNENERCKTVSHPNCSLHLFAHLLFSFLFISIAQIVTVNASYSDPDSSFSCSPGDSVSDKFPHLLLPFLWSSLFWSSSCYFSIETDFCSHSCGSSLVRNRCQ